MAKARIARAFGLVGLVGVLLALQARPTVAGNIPSTALDETAPVQAVSPEALQAVQAKLTAGDFSPRQADSILEQLTTDEINEVANHPAQVRVAHGLSWYWWSVLLGVAVWLFRSIFGK